MHLLPGLPAGKVRCGLCCLREFCAPGDVGCSELELLKSFVRKQDIAVEKGAQLYRQGDEFRGLLAVHTGSFKLVVASPDGSERVSGFAFAGDLMGLDAIAAGRHGDYAVALEKGGACLLPWQRVEEAAAGIPVVRRQLMRLLSREIRRADEHRGLLARLDAEARFAAFLVGLSERMADRGFDGRRLRLTMSRPDIASFLGLSAETVSRLFSRFHDQGYVRVRARHVELDADEALRALARSEKSPSRAKLTRVSIPPLLRR